MVVAVVVPVDVAVLVRVDVAVLVPVLVTVVVGVVISHSANVPSRYDAVALFKMLAASTHVDRAFSGAIEYKVAKGACKRRNATKRENAIIGWLDHRTPC